MKKFTMRVTVCLVAVLAMGCNLTAASTPTILRGSTPGPTPTLVSAADCPPYAFDSFAADFAQLTDPARFIGKHYNPDDYYDVFGMNNGEMLDEVHALEQYYKDTLVVDFLERIVCRNSDGKAFSEVKDALILNLTKDQSLSVFCWAGDQPMEPVLAWGHVDINQPYQVYQDVAGYRFDRVDIVYRIDLERETFTPMPTKGVVCLAVLRI